VDSNGFRTGIIANGSAGGVTMEYGVKLPQLRRYFAVEIQDNCQKISGCFPQFYENWRCPKYASNLAKSSL